MKENIFLAVFVIWIFIVTVLSGANYLNQQTIQFSILQRDGLINQYVQGNEQKWKQLDSFLNQQTKK